MLIKVQIIKRVRIWKKKISLRSIIIGKFKINERIIFKIYELIQLIDIRITRRQKGSYTKWRFLIWWWLNGEGKNLEDWKIDVKYYC